MKIKKIIISFITDFNATFFYILWEFNSLVLNHTFTLLEKITLKLMGVKYGKKCYFRGFSTFKRQPMSSINIGNNCTFNSISHFNLRGISHKCIIQTGKRGATLKIGDNCGLSGCTILCNIKVEIGTNVIIGVNSSISDHDDHSERYKSNSSEVIIGDNVWIGMNVVILKGVKIGKNSIIGAGSIVTKDIPSNVVAAGVPCKIIKEINEN